MTLDRPLLGFDTSGPYCAAALLHKDGKVSVRVEERARGQAERLMGLLEEMLADVSLRWADLAALGVGVGPGNFTGIRIAISAARGLSLGLGVPVVGVSRFETTERLSGSQKTSIPATRDQFYVFDAATDAAPVLRSDKPDRPFVTSTAFSTQEHMKTLATIAAERARSVTSPPKPLYVKAPDAAPARDAPPRVLP